MSSPSPHTRRTASSVAPPAKTANRRASARSGSPSRSQLQSTTARSVRWRGSAVRGAGGEQPEPVVEAAADLLGPERPQAGRGQLDRERLPVEPPADLHDRRSARRRSPRSPAATAAPRSANRRAAVVVGPSGVDGVQHLAGHAERLAARGEHPQAGGALAAGSARGAAAPSTTCSQLSSTSSRSRPASASSIRVPVPVPSGARATISGLPTAASTAAGSWSALPSGASSTIATSPAPCAADLAGQPGLARRRPARSA